MSWSSVVYQGLIAILGELTADMALTPQDPRLLRRAYLVSLLSLDSDKRNAHSGSCLGPIQFGSRHIYDYEEGNKRRQAGQY